MRLRTMMPGVCQVTDAHGVATLLPPSAVKEFEVSRGTGTRRLLAGLSEQGEGEHQRMQLRAD